jgi:hypothetical protein
MTYLSRPRLVFFAQDAMTNPSTANNENVIHLLDANNVEVLNPPVVVGADFPKMDDAAYRAWMTSLVTYADPGTDPQPDWQPTMPGYWNYYGDHLTTFGSAKVTGALLAGGGPDADTTDPLVGTNVVFNAKLVDLNPADTFCSQLIAATFKLMGPGADGKPVELLAGSPTIAYTRWLNFMRPHAAGNFQSVIPNDALTFVEKSDAPASPALEALRDGARAGGGLLLRYCLYFLQAKQTMPQMYDRFQAGEIAMNPKFGCVLGTLGVWNGQDLESGPVGRMLYQPGPPFAARHAHPKAAAADAPQRKIKSHEDVAAVSAPEPEGAPAAAAATTPNPTAVWPAVAIVEPDRILLDLLTTFPEQKHSASRAKVDYGPVDLVVTSGEDGTENVVTIGSVPYDRTTYEAGGGVIEIPLPAGSPAAGALEQGLLQLRQADGIVLLAETEIVEVETDDRCVYLDFGDDGVARGQVRINVFARGKPITRPVRIRLEQWADEMSPGEANSLDPLVVIACAMSDRLVQPNAPAYALPARTWTVPAGGRATLDLVARKPGCFKIRFIAPGMHVDPSSPNFAFEYFTNFRVLPHDDYSSVPDEKITWEFIYDEVFSYYNVLYPIMATIIPWGPATSSDPERVAQFASLIRQAVDESRAGTALAMPITRELSAGKRALVQRWCDLQLAAVGS